MEFETDDLPTGLPAEGLDRSEWHLLIVRGQSSGQLLAEDVAHVLRHVELTADTLQLPDWPAKGGVVPKDVYATAFFAHDTDLLGKMAAVLGVTPGAVKIWNRHGLLHGHAYNDRNECLYETPGNNPPRKSQGKKLSERRAAIEVPSENTKEVQCEA